MKPVRLGKRILAFALCFAMLAGDGVNVRASENTEENTAVTLSTEEDGLSSVYGTLQFTGEDAGEVSTADLKSNDDAGNYYYYTRVQFWDANLNCQIGTLPEEDGEVLGLLHNTNGEWTLQLQFTPDEAYNFVKTEVLNPWGNTKCSSENQSVDITLTSYAGSVSYGSEGVNTIRFYVTPKTTNSAQIVTKQGVEGYVALGELMEVADNGVLSLSAKNDAFTGKLTELTESVWDSWELGWYEYSYAAVGDTTISYLKEENGAYYYTTSKKAGASAEWTALGEQQITFVHKNVSGKTKVATVDTRDLIQLNLCNYTLTSGNSINDGHNLNFFAYGATTGSSNKNWYTGSSNLYAGIVQNTLGEDGYPVLTKKEGGESLSYLFDDSEVTGKTGIYENASYLFAYDSATGYYSYDSAKQDAVLNTQTNDFTVYSGSDGFFPFGTDNIDNKFSFGMNMGVSFIQPKNGEIAGSDMVFDFSGDDDVWVYLDGVLVLDLGGIHGAATGSINFATGEVTGYNVANAKSYGASTTDTTIYDAYVASGLFTDEQLAEMFDITYAANGSVQSAVYSDYTNHSMKVFYLERGGTASNCKITFNIPAVPQNTISVTKKVSALDSNAAIDKDETYQFQLYCGDTAADCTLVQNTTYDIYENGIDTGVDGTVGADGIFYLKNGQTAVFAQSANEKYFYAKELSVSDEYTVYADGVKLTDEGNGTYTSSVSQIVNGAGNILVTNRFDTVDYKIGTTKTATLTDWEDRTYEINLGAYHSNVITETMDTVLVLDVSGSMPWMLEKPSAGTYTITSKELRSKTVRAAQQAKNDTVTDWSYDYFVAVEENGVTEYRPVTWNGSKWVRVESKSNGEKNYNVKNATITEDTKIYKKASTQLTKLESLQNSVKDFMERMAETSPESRIAVITFAGEVKSVTDFTACSEMASDILDNVQLYGGTKQNVALDQAASILEKSDNTNKSCILFTDGAPNGVSVAEVTKSAESLKKNTNATLYVVGLCKEQTTLKDAVDAWASEGCSTVNTSAENLMESFKSIFNEITKSITTKIIDYVDSRFYLLADVGSVIDSSNYSGKTVNGGTVGYDSEKDQLYVVWEDAQVGYGSADQPNWAKSFFIQAKEDYIGGNAVTTNGTESGVIYSGKTTKFPQPTVNVRIAVNALDDEDTIFLGESLEGYFTAEKAAAMTDDIESRQTYGDTDISIIWKNEAGEEVTREEIAQESPTEDTFYMVTVTVTPNVADTSEKAEKAAESMKNEDEIRYTATMQNGSDEAAESVTADGTYTVKVVSGTLVVTKKIKRDDINLKQGDPIFMFEVSNGTTTYTKTVRFDADTLADLKEDADGYVSLSTEFCGLEKGNYTVSELKTMRYVTKSVEVETTDCAYEIENFVAQVAVGKAALTDATTNLKANEATVLFCNEKNQDDNFSDTDEVINHFSVKDGKIVITPEKVPVQK